MGKRSHVMASSAAKTNPCHSLSETFLKLSLELLGAEVLLREVLCKTWGAARLHGQGMQMHMPQPSTNKIAQPWLGFDQTAVQATDEQTYMRCT